MILYNFDLNILIINKNYIVNYNKIKNNIYLNIINDTDIEKINFNDFESFKEYCKKNTDIDYNKIINIINDNKFDIIEYLNDNIELINNTNNSNIINNNTNSFPLGIIIIIIILLLIIMILIVLIICFNTTTNK